MALPKMKTFVGLPTGVWREYNEWTSANPDLQFVDSLQTPRRYHNEEIVLSVFYTGNEETTEDTPKKRGGTIPVSF